MNISKAISYSIKSALLLFVLLLLTDVCRADKWTRKADFPGVWRMAAFSFVINNKAYVGGGETIRDLWEYNQELDTWTKKASPPFGTFWIPSEGIGNFAYVYSDTANLIWEYSPKEDKWSVKTQLPGPNKHFPFSFAIGNKIYIGGGTEFPQRIFHNNFYCYDPVTDVWTELTNLPTTMSQARTFTINNKGYATGILNGYVINRELWEYDTKSNAWTRKADFPGIPRSDISAFSIGIDGYAGLGQADLNTSVLDATFKDWWKYNASTDSWKMVDTLPSELPKDECPAFVINFKAYICFGMNGHNISEVWEYTPDSVKDAIICPGATINLNNDTVNNKWTSSNPNVIAIDKKTGIAKGGMPGSAVVENNNSGSPETFMITVPPRLNIVSTVSPIKCHGANNAAIAATINSGSGSVNYKWSNNSFLSHIDSLVPNTYFLTVRDNFTQCTATDSFNIEEPEPLTLTTVVNNDTCDESKGSVHVSVQGGVPWYQYLWTNNKADSVITELPGGSYSLVVTDKNKCKKGYTAIVVDEDCMPTLLYPNPANDILHITSGHTIKKVVIYNIAGQRIYYNRPNISHVIVDLSKFPVGGYIVRINDTDIRKFVRD